MKDNMVEIQGKHEERKDPHGYVSRQFSRKYVLPEGAKVEEVTSQLGRDGILVIQAPKNAPALKQGERKIPITFEQK